MREGCVRTGLTVGSITRGGSDVVPYGTYRCVDITSAQTDPHHPPTLDLRASDTPFVFTRPRAIFVLSVQLDVVVCVRARSVCMFPTCTPLLHTRKSLRTHTFLQDDEWSSLRLSQHPWAVSGASTAPRTANQVCCAKIHRKVGAKKKGVLKVENGV
jgi:hypothetical protein